MTGFNEVCSCHGPTGYEACAACCADPCDECREWIMTGAAVRPIGDGVVTQSRATGKVVRAHGAIGQDARTSRPCEQPLRTLTAEGYETEDCGECGPCTEGGSR